MTAWASQCVLCAARGRRTRLESGHLCPGCVAWLDGRLESMTESAKQSGSGERTSSGGYSSRSFESKPPADLDAMAPWLALVQVYPMQPLDLRPVVASVLADWERIVRDMRYESSYGLATEAHVGTSEIALAAQAAEQAVAFLRASLGWMADAPEFPVEDFASEVRACASRMAALASKGTARDRIVECPTITDERDGDGAFMSCGTPLSVRTWSSMDGDPTTGEDVTCPRCHATRSPLQLAHAGGHEATWLDSEAMSTIAGVSERTLRRWAEAGHVRREHGRYSLHDVRMRLADGLGA